MLVTAGNLASISTGFNTTFNKGFGAVDPIYSKVAMMTRSSGSEETYAWLGQMPEIREWFGSRIVHTLSVQGYTIRNRKFESTVEVARTDIEDDKIGVYGPMFEDMGRRTAEHPDQLLAELMDIGTATMCYDGQNFFDVDHPVTVDNGAIASVSNYQDGAGPTWYMLDLSRAVRPFIYQERVPYQLTRRDQPEDENVFSLDTFLYGVRGRSNVGFGLWQLARASRAALTEANYEAGRVAMATLRGDNRKKLGVKCTHVVVPAELEGDARRLLKNQLAPNGGTNPWADSAEIIVSPWL